jgi:ABC-2 type transport system ATP-binding protein
LAGDHTIILSTHILPEVEQTCQSVLIINKGRLVAKDTVDNLQNRARGAEQLFVEIAGRGDDVDSAIIQQRLERVPGVTHIVFKEKQQNRSIFEIESHKDNFVRGELARAVVESGWDLNELRPAAVSLEEIFLQLTGEPAAVESSDEAVATGAA